jgi:23S rRNA pseudouridine1911/1915/1917 synthase
MSIKIQISKDYIGSRLDVAVSSIYKDLSRTQFQKCIKSGGVLLNETIVNDRAFKILCPCCVEITFVDSVEDNFYAAPENIPLDIVFEDDYIVVINKMAGMVCHPSPGHRTGTLVNSIVNKFGKNLSDAGGIFRPGIVHRLDKDTSGLMIVAKTNCSHFKFAKLFAEGKGSLIRRKYLCFVFGAPSPRSGRIETFIKRHPVLRQQYMASNDLGKYSITAYSTLNTAYFNKDASISKVECELFTGRTHQIRVHMAHIGNPIIGDKTYGKKKNTANVYPKTILLFSRQALHSAELLFTHPITNENLIFKSSLPTDMADLDAIFSQK